jgi:Protein of unknown function (DUF3168)
VSVNVRSGLWSKLASTPAVTAKLAAAHTGYEKAIYHEQAPTDAAFPYIVFSKMAGTKVRAMQTPEAFKRETWMVKAVDRGTSSKLAEEIAEAIDATLDGGTLTVTGKTVADLNHVGDIDYSESSGDQQYRHIGATYRLTLT